MKSGNVKNKKQNDVPIYISHIFSSIFGILKAINTGLQGSKNPEIMEMLGFGPSHNKTEILLDQN